MKKKKSKALLVSWIVSALYLAYLLQYIFSTAGAVQGDSAAAIGTGIGIMLILPHLLLVALAFIFNVLGWSMNLRWSALTGGILYCVSALLMFIYTPFVLLQIILSFVGFAKIKGIIESNKQVAAVSEAEGA